MANHTIVLKFGSSVLRSAADLPAVVHEIYRWRREGWRVVVIVSALNDTTETLLDEARQLSIRPEPTALAELLATGERKSAALMGIALDRAGVPARVIDPRELAFTTQGSPLEAEPVRVDRSRCEALLAQHGVLVVPGFFGYDENGRMQLLGRGGSDLSAVFLADATDAAQCRLLKDVDGVYERDPAAAGEAPVRRYATLGYEQALESATQLIQPKAVQFLAHRRREAAVAALGRSYESIVGALDCTYVAPRMPPPLRVLILGLGVVGAGVYARLLAAPEHFQIVGALARDLSKHAKQGIPQSLLFDDQDELAKLPVDVVVDALPGLEPSRSLARYFLAHGVSVVSANKVLICDCGPQFELLAEPGGAALLYSAAVGASAPMIEAVRREAQKTPITELTGILNGTSNYILTRCSEGASIEEATRAAQAAGFAEADPDEDVSGRDAARKLRILARLAFGEAPDHISVEAISRQTLANKQSSLTPRETLRHVARTWTSGGRVFGVVELQAVATDSPLGRTRDEWNMLQVTRGDEKSEVTGRGAGRWPTVESIIADLMELVRRRSSSHVRLDSAR